MVSLKCAFVSGPVRAVRALELWLDAALVALMPLEVVGLGVGLAAALAAIQTYRRNLFKFLCLRKGHVRSLLVSPTTTNHHVVLQP
jgi:hypothetical protein